MTTTLRDLAALVHGELQGDAALVLSGAAALAEARPGDITFIDSDKRWPQMRQSQASAAIVPLGVAAPDFPVIGVRDPLDAFVTVLRFFRGHREPAGAGIDARACLHPTVQVGAGASIGPMVCVGEGTTIGARCRLHSGAVIGRDCRLGDDVVIYPNAVLYDNTILGHRVTIHANAVLGADGFGFRTLEGRHVKAPQLGHVEIGDDVEIGACTTIDRGTFHATRVGTGTKIDNLVQIGHNCQIGMHNLLVSQLGIAGSSSTGNYVVIAGQAGIADHVHVGDRAMIGAQAGVTRDIPAGQRVFGAPAHPEGEQKRILLSLERLPEFRKDLQRIKRHLGLDEERSLAS